MRAGAMRMGQFDRPAHCVPAALAGRASDSYSERQPPARPDPQLSPMNKPVFGLVSGLAAIVLALIAIGVVNMPRAEGADRVAPSSRCAPASEHAPEQGYGLLGRADAPPCRSGR